MLSKNKAYEFVPFEKLYDISGRSVKRQEQLAKQFGIKTYPSHGGGCLLTDPAFGRKMQTLFADGVLTQNNQFVCQAIHFGRLLKYQAKQYVIVGRNEAENNQIEKYFKFCTHISAVTPMVNDSIQLPGPSMLVLDFTQDKSGLPTIPFVEAKINENAEIEDLKPGKCTLCTALKNYSNDEFKDVHYKASDELLQFALKVYNAYCKGKGEQDCELTLDSEKNVMVPKVGKEFLQELMDKYLLK